MLLITRDEAAGCFPCTFEPRGRAWKFRYTLTETSGEPCTTAPRIEFQLFIGNSRANCSRAGSFRKKQSQPPRLSTGGRTRRNAAARIFASTRQELTRHDRRGSLEVDTGLPWDAKTSIVQEGRALCFVNILTGSLAYRVDLDGLLIG